MGLMMSNVKWWRARNAPWVAFMALAILLAALFFSLTWQTGDDDRYYGLALSLTRGLGYTAAYLPHAPPETITPPGHPWLLWLVMSLLGEGVWVGKLMSALFFVAACGLVFRWARREQDGQAWAAAVLAAAGMFSVYTLAMSCWFMAEMTFLLFSFAVVAHWPSPGDAFSWRRAALLGLLAGYAYLTRSVGLALLAAAGVDLLVRRRWSGLLAFGAGAALVVLPWSIRNYLVAQSPDVTLALFTQMAGAGASRYPWMRVFHDIGVAFPQYYFTDLPRVLFYNVFDGRDLLARVLTPAGAAAVRWTFLGFVTAGFLLRLRRPRLPEFYWIFYWLLISAPPFPPQGHWYVIPMLPLAALYAADAARRLLRCVGRDTRMPAFALGVSVTVLALLGGVAHAVKELPRWGRAPWDPERYRAMHNEYMDAWAGYVEAALWIGSNLPPDTAVVSRKPQHVWIMTGRQGWRYDAPDVPGTNLLDRLERVAATRPVVVMEDAFPSYEGATFSYGASRSALSRFLHDEQARFELVFQANSRVWRYRGAASR